MCKRSVGIKLDLFEDVYNIFHHQSSLMTISWFVLSGHVKVLLDLLPTANAVRDA